MKKKKKCSEVFLVKGLLKICSKFTVEHQRRSVISIKLQSNFIEITLRHGYSPANLLHIFRTPFPNNTSEGLLLYNLNFGKTYTSYSHVNLQKKTFFFIKKYLRDYIQLYSQLYLFIRSLLRTLLFPLQHFLHEK